jgi:hypothetical protein
VRGKGELSWLHNLYDFQEEEKKSSGDKHVAFSEKPASEPQKHGVKQSSLLRNQLNSPFPRTYPPTSFPLLRRATEDVHARAHLLSLT